MEMAIPLKLILANLSPATTMIWVMISAWNACTLICKPKTEAAPLSFNASGQPLAFGPSSKIECQ